MVSTFKNVLIGIAIFMLCITLFWLFMSDYIVWVYSFITFKMYSLIPYLNLSEILSLLRKSGKFSANVTIADFAFIVNKTGRIYLPFYVIISLYFIYKIFKSPHTVYTRQFTVDGLAKNIVQRSPSSAYILKRYQHYTKQLLNYTDEETASPLSPQEFAEKYQLINPQNQYFNKSTADHVFRQQINFNSFKDGQLVLTEYERVLVCIFILAHKFTDYDNAKLMLYKLNLSCLETDTGLPNFASVDNEVTQTMQHPIFLESQQGYSSSRTYLYALLDNDLSIPPAHFRWLKVIDRILWMALTSVGRGKKFVEGAGIIAYSITETWIKNNKQYENLNIKPSVRSATNGLEKELFRGRLIKNYEPRIPTGKFKYVNELEAIRFKTAIFTQNPIADKEETKKEDKCEGIQTETPDGQPSVTNPPIIM